MDPGGAGQGVVASKVLPQARHFPALPVCWLPASQGSRSTQGASTASHLPSVCHGWEGWC